MGGLPAVCPSITLDLGFSGFGRRCPSFRPSFRAKGGTPSVGAPSARPAVCVPSARQPALTSTVKVSAGVGRGWPGLPAGVRSSVCVPSARQPALTSTFEVPAGVGLGC